MLEKSEYKTEIENFLSQGGQVTVLPPEIGGRTPSIGVALKLGGWDMETLLGFGMEIDLMEETNPDLVGLK